MSCYRQAHSSSTIRIYLCSLLPAHACHMLEAVVNSDENLPSLLEASTIMREKKNLDGK